MDEEIKILANKTVERIYRKVKKDYKSNFYRFGNNISIGADGTPTKYVDKIAEDAALDFLNKSDVKVNILSEEAGFIDNNSEYTFVLDPVDGTHNAYRGIPFYSVSLAVGKKELEDVEFGIVKNISTGDIFQAEKKEGAYLNNKKIAIPEIPEKMSFSSLSLGKNSDKRTLHLSKKGKIRSLGSASLEMCMVAIGALDYYIMEKEFLRVIDLAASTLIVREGGGFVTDITGKRLNMSLKLDERTSVITACNKKIIKDIVSI
ncbi:MAG: inositol monophosphatase family protein [Candidatus Thermoplasmatota archaeon]